MGRYVEGIFLLPRMYATASRGDSLPYFLFGSSVFVSCARGLFSYQQPLLSANGIVGPPLVIVSSKLLLVVAPYTYWLKTAHNTAGVKENGKNQIFSLPFYEWRALAAPWTPSSKSISELISPPPPPPPSSGCRCAPDNPHIETGLKH